MRAANGDRSIGPPLAPGEAKRLRQDLENEYLEGGEIAVQSDEMTFAQLAKHCQETKYCEAEYDDAGNKLFGVRDTSVYEAHLKHFKEFFGKIRLRDIKVENLRAYRNQRVRSKTKGGGNVNVGTVNREMNTLRAMLNEARINDWIPVSPFTRARPGGFCQLNFIREQTINLDKKRSSFYRLFDSRSL
ncbi:MAG: phage integrase SAM-like domain-containing protein [Pyrinomonadaceae bacterium]|nr:phage integrase SAM-like domain-containing protein [Pyrinomonadaceae bacterium]